MTYNSLIIKTNFKGKKFSCGTGEKWGLSQKPDNLESPSITLDTDISAEGDGTNLLGEQFDARTINLYVFKKEVKTNAQDYRILRSYFPFKSQGTITIKRNDVERKINARVTGLKISHKNINTRVGAMITFYCNDPFFYDIKETNIPMSAKLPMFHGEFAIPRNLQTAFSVREYKKIAEINNLGEYPVGIKARIRAERGRVINPYLVNFTTGGYIQTQNDLILEQGDSLEINTLSKQKSLYLYKGNNRTPLNVSNHLASTTSFANFKLVEGVNHLSYGSTSGYINMEVLLKYSQIYLGV